MTVAVAVAVRALLVVLFFPFSALDKTINFKGAVGQAQELVGSIGPARMLILAGLSDRNHHADLHSQRRG